MKLQSLLNHGSLLKDFEYLKGEYKGTEKVLYSIVQLSTFPVTLSGDTSGSGGMVNAKKTAME